MSHGYPKSIKYKGANSGDEIIGLAKRNRGMVLKLWDGQPKGPGRWPNGRVDVLEAGSGDYAKYLKEFVAETWEARELHDAVLELVNTQKRKLGQKVLSNLTIFDLNSLGLRENAREVGE